MVGERTEPEGTLPDEVVMDLVSSDRRQLLLVELACADAPLTVADMVHTLCYDTDDCESRPGEVDRGLLSELFSEHLSKLVATGVVEYDPMRGTVELARPELLAVSRSHGLD